MSGQFDFAPWSSPEGAVDGAFRVGLRPIPEARWLPVPEDLQARLAQRRSVLRNHLHQAWADPPAARAAARELLALLRRHTQQQLRSASTAGPEPGSESRCEREALAECNAADLDGDPLLAAAALVPDDLCLLAPDDPPRLRAGVLTAPSGWRLDQRLGQDLHALHGPVDGLDDAIGARMRAFIERLPAGRIFERGNWSLYDDGAYWRPGGAALGRVPEAVRTAPDVAQHLWLRREQQTLQRLPESGWILFTIRVHLAPVTALAAEPLLAAHLRRAMASLTERERRARRIDEVGAGLDAWLGAVPRDRSTSTQECAASDGSALRVRRDAEARPCRR